MAPGISVAASSNAAALRIIDRIFIFLLWGFASGRLEALPNSEARVRTVESLGKVDAHRAQAQLRHVEANAGAGVTHERPVRRVPGDPIGEGIEQREGSPDPIVELVDEQRQGNPAVERQ